MGKCKSCGKFISGSVETETCGGCSGSLHKSKGHVSSAPPKGPLVGGEVSSGSTAAAYEKLVAAIDNLAQEMRGLRAEMSEFRATVAGLDIRVGGMEQRLEALERQEPAATSATSAPDSRVVELEVTVNALKMELIEREQEALLSDLEVGHLPEERGENPVHVVTVLASRLGVSLEERDVVFAERVGAPPAQGERPRRLVVRLARRHTRDELLRAARVRRTLTASSASAPGGESHPRIFLNERLSRLNRQLFHRAREVCRERQWRYVWTRQGRILVKQAEGKPVFRLKSMADLDQVFGPAQALGPSQMSGNF